MSQRRQGNNANQPQRVVQDWRRRENLYSNDGTRNCRGQSNQCIYARRDTHERCKMCTRDTSRYCWQHRFNPSLRIFDDRNQIHINSGIIREVTEEQDLAPRIVDNLANGYGEFFISFVLRKIKDQCRHIEIPITTNINVVKVNITLNTMGPQWRPFITYVRCMYDLYNTGSAVMMHFVLTNFYKHPADVRQQNQRQTLNDPMKYTITVWSPQLTFLQDPEMLCSIMHELFNPQTGNNVAQIFNCFVNRNATINFMPVYSCYDSRHNLDEKRNPDPTRFGIRRHPTTNIEYYDTNSVYVLECLCMVKYLVLQVQKYQRSIVVAHPRPRGPRRLNMWLPRNQQRSRSRTTTPATAIVPAWQNGADNRPFPNELCSIFFFDYDTFFMSLGFTYRNQKYHPNPVTRPTQQGDNANAATTRRESYRIVMRGEVLFDHLIRQGTEHVSKNIKALFAQVALNFYANPNAPPDDTNPNEHLTIRPDPYARNMLDGDDVQCDALVHRRSYNIINRLKPMLEILYDANRIDVWTPEFAAAGQDWTNERVDQMLIERTQFANYVRSFLGQDAYDEMMNNSTYVAPQPDDSLFMAAAPPTPPSTALAATRSRSRSRSRTVANATPVATRTVAAANAARRRSLSSESRQRQPTTSRALSISRLRRRPNAANIANANAANNDFSTQLGQVDYLDALIDNDNRQLQRRQSQQQFDILNQIDLNDIDQLLE